MQLVFFFHTSGGIHSQTINRSMAANAQVSANRYQAVPTNAELLNIVCVRLLPDTSARPKITR